MPSISRNSTIFLIFTLCFIGAFATFFQNCSTTSAENTTPFADQYIGSGQCQSCHEEAYEDWLNSHHDLAMQEANTETVLGDFNDVSFTSNGVTTKFFQKEGAFFVNTEGPDGSFQDFEIKYTFGVEPLQQYMVAFPDGRVQCLLTAWDTEEKKWFDLMPDERQAPDDWLHWSKGSMTWNTMCADCHSTYLEKNFDEATNTYHTEWKIMDVSCEACHGPGQQHVEYVESDAYANGQKVKDAHLFMTASLSSQEQVEACARCHARRGPISEVFDHSGDLMDHYVPDAISARLYHGDGQIDDEVYVYGSFLQSKMYRSNVQCTHCHNPHSLKLKAVGNDLCGQCHVKAQYDTPEHHFHAQSTESAQCVNCHMTGKIYMGNDFRRDHSFRVPRPDLSVLYDTPNACTGCHKDQSAEWAAKAVEKWYGTDRPPHFSPVLAAARSGDLQAMPGLVQMMGDTSIPQIIQAAAVQIMGEVPVQETSRKIIEALQHEDPLIRYTAINAMVRFSAEDRVRYLSPLLSDPVRAVRTQAAYQLADVNEQLFYGEAQVAFQAAKKEFESVLSVQADFPSGQLMRGQYYHKMGDLDQATIAYKEAIRQDPYLAQPYFNLANLYYAQGNFDEAIKQFNNVIKVDSNAIDAYYSLGLLLAERQDMANASTYLEKAAKLSGNPRYYYNWGLTLQNLDQAAAAELAFQQGLDLAPEDEGLLYAMAVLYIQQQRRSDAQPIVMQLLQLNPQSQEYQGLLRAVQ